ncbi:hypothetical protein NQZ68_041970 [Dissostichus eleginoides]|nr:hypothetical protein NQZ68_041970 [Dissostichus eleginoides]
MQVGLWIGHEGPLLDSFPLEVFNVAVVVEEKIILHDLRDVPAGFAVLMGAIYCLNLEYPRTQKYTAEISPLNNGLSGGQQAKQRTEGKEVVNPYAFLN